MAGVLGLHTVGEGIVGYLTDAFERWKTAHPAPAPPDLEFHNLSSGEMNAQHENPSENGATISLYLYRVTVDEHARNGRAATGAGSRGPLSLDLHFLLTVWAGKPRAEQFGLAWTMRELHGFTTLDASSLSADGLWGANETVSLNPCEIGHEEMTQIWNALDRPYHLSVTYLARFVRLDPDLVPTGQPVVATRLRYEEIVR